MAIQQRYTLVCDDIRVENTGKLFVTPDVIVEKLPFTIPLLAFLQAYDVDTAGTLKFRAALQHTDSESVIAEATGVLDIPESSLMGFAVLKFGNLRFENGGRYSFVMTINGQSEPLIHTFNISARLT